MVSDGGPLDLDRVRDRYDLYRQHFMDTATRGWSCCSAHGPADDVPALVAEVERLTQFATSLGKALDARLGDVRRRDDEIESLRRQRAAERDVIEKAKALAAIEARQSDVRGLGGAGEWVKQQTAAVIAVCAAVDALRHGQRGGPDGTDDPNP
jgi:hypothetical protein